MRNTYKSRYIDMIYSNVLAASVKTAAAELYRSLSATKWTFMKGIKSNKS